MKKTKYLAVLICLFFVFAQINIYASDVEMSSEETAAASSAITEQFDTDSGMYIEKLSKGLEFISSIPNGAVVSDGVYFEIPSNISVQLQKDGEYIDFYNKTAVASQGYYILRLSGTSAFGETTTGVFTFRIGSAPSNKADNGEYKYPKITSTATVSLDEGTGLYKFTLPNYKAFFTNISAYGETVQNASFIIPRNLGYSLKRNGSNISYMKNKTYTEAGNYTLKIFGYSYASGGGYEACYETTLNFTISSGEAASSYADELAAFSAAVSSASSGTTASASVSADTSAAASAESSIISDTLRESYFETANIYSESFSTGDSFYTNIPNDGIVGGNVYFDIPYNMSVSLMRDGTPVEFKNKTYINDSGSYSMTVTDVFEGVTSRAKFSFRIQSGVETPEGVMTDDTEESDENGDAFGFGEEVSYSVTNEYDTTSRMYVFSLGGENVYMSVPNGMVSNQEVRFNISDNVEKGLFRNDEEIEYSDTVYDDGRYVLSLVKDGEALNLEFYIARDPVNYMDEFILPEGYSLITADYSDYAGVYSETDEVYNEGLNEIELQNESYSSNVFSLPIDGEYDFILQGSRGMSILSFSLFIDRTAPVITFEGLDENMSTSEKEVTIHCSETDAEVVLADASGNETPLDMSGGGGKISGKGTYTLIARDAVGNESQYQFVLGASGSLAVKIYLVVFLLVFIGLIVVAVIFVRKLLFGSGDKKDKKEKKDKKSEDKKADKDKETENENKEGEENDGKTNIFEKKDEPSLIDKLLAKLPEFGEIKLPNLGGLKKKPKKDNNALDEASAEADIDSDDWEDDDSDDWESDDFDFEDDGWEDDGDE
ncbi:MAG: hypothetical protein LUG66_05495 [Clostridiales bacterium]|nr:hypothetical protein [Clostridiales bacterium]